MKKRMLYTYDDAWHFITRKENENDTEEKTKEGGGNALHWNLYHCWYQLGCGKSHHPIPIYNLGFLVFFGSCDQFQFQHLQKAMKIFDWIHGKIHGKQSVNKPNSNTAANVLHACEKEEFSDWPNGLLAIGTFGINSVKDSAEKCSNNLQGTPASCEDQQDQELTAEEVGELSKELKLLVHKHSVNGSEKESVTLQKLFDCLQNMEEDEETAITELIPESSGKEDSTKHGKEVQMETSSNNISKKSLSFLLKKAILCRGGFTPPPPPPPPLPLRERFPVETKFEKSRMAKILRAILHKKIYPHSSNPRAATKKYMDKNLYLCENVDDDSEDEAVGKAIEGSKWVKTDSDFIVLEI